MAMAEVMLTVRRSYEKSFFDDSNILPSFNVLSFFRQFEPQVFLFLFLFIHVLINRKKYKVCSYKKKSV